jgi:hypothetical protein
MSQTLILELNDQVYTAIRRQAETAGTSPAHWIADTLERQYGGVCANQDIRASLTEAEKQAARERFERHFGEVDLGYEMGVDNEQIDADIARAIEMT